MVFGFNNILNYVDSQVVIWQNVLFKIEYIPRIENMLFPLFLRFGLICRLKNTSNIV